MIDNVLLIAWFLRKVQPNIVEFYILCPPRMRIAEESGASLYWKLELAI